MKEITAKNHLILKNYGKKSIEQVDSAEERYARENHPVW